MSHFIIFLTIMSSLALADTASIYELPTSWLTPSGASITLKEVHNGPVVIGMVYTTCPHACPMTISKMQTIQKMMKDKGVKNVRFVLASFDFEKDKPEKLLAYMKLRKLDPKEWTFLSPQSEQDARELAVILGISYRKLEDGHFSHSNVMTLLDKKGVPRSKLEGLSADPVDFVETARQLK